MIPIPEPVNRPHGIDQKYRVSDDSDTYFFFSSALFLLHFFFLSILKFSLFHVIYGYTDKETGICSYILQITFMFFYDFPNIFHTVSMQSVFFFLRPKLSIFHSHCFLCTVLNLHVKKPVPSCKFHMNPWIFRSHFLRCLQCIIQKIPK